MAGRSLCSSIGIQGRERCVHFVVLDLSNHHIGLLSLAIQSAQIQLRIASDFSARQKRRTAKFQQLEENTVMLNPGNRPQAVDARFHRDSNSLYTPVSLLCSDFTLVPPVRHRVEVDAAYPIK